MQREPVIPLPPSLPQHEPALYAAMRTAGADAAEAVRLVTSIWRDVRPVQGAQEAVKAAIRAHARGAAPRSYTASL